ncbi:MAG: type II secretion system F family protein [Anaerolineae bacterium]|nr:MAG: type II secretion system F family protein [Anaerolineae bacterium]
MLWLWIILAVVVIGAVILVVVGLRSDTAEDPIQARLEEFAERGEPVSLEELELSQPLRERIFIPMARRMGEFILRFTPQNAIQNTTLKLERAGKSLDPTVFWGLRVAGLALGGVFIIVGRLAPPGSFMDGRGLIFGLPMAILGFFLPEMWLSSQITRRQDAIRKAMPDALDLLTICVEAGLGFDAAMAKVNEKWDNELALAFGRVIREVQLGKLRREALRDMADNLGVAEMSSFVAAVIQSEQLGVSMAKVLRIQSEQMRIRRRQAAEEQAHQAPVKMLFPMVFLIFPSLMIVLLGPAALILMHSALGAMFAG